MKTSLDMRTQQFDEQVKRSLYNVMRTWSRTKRDYLEQDMIESENRYSRYNQPRSSHDITGDNTPSTIIS